MVRKAGEKSGVVTPSSIDPIAMPPASLKLVEPLLPLTEAASFLSVSVKTLRREISAGALPVIRIGRALRIRPADLRRYMNAHWNG